MLGFSYEGCSCRSAFQMGATEWFVERGLEIGAVTGASSGSLLAVAVASQNLPALREAWESLFGTVIFQPRMLFRGRWPWRMSHILAGALDTWLGERKVAELSLPIGIVVTTIGWRGRRRRVITRHDDIRVARAIRASSFIPGPYSRMVPIDGRLTFDGAWEERAPVREAFTLGAERVVAVTSDPRGGLRGGVLRPRTVPVPSNVRVLHPDKPLPLVGFDFDGEATAETVRLGRRAAERFARAHEGWL